MFSVYEGKRPEFKEISAAGPKTRTLWHQFNSLIIVNKLLYRRFEHPSGIKDREELHLILPEALVGQTVKAYHQQLGAGNHFGITKTLAYLKRYFWWPGMRDDVWDIILQCEICMKHKGPTQQVRAPLKLFQEGVLHGRWQVDLCGPIAPKTKDGYQYILVAVEAFSGWPAVVPLKTQTAQEIAQALITHVFSIFGAPQSILTDQGKPFESQLFHEIMNLYDIRKTRTSAYHPSANGKAERWIKTLKEHLAMLVQNDPKEWPNYLPFIAQAYRNLPHAAHGFSPYEVMFGARMRTPLDMVRGTPPIPQKMVKQYPYWVQHTLNLIHETVREMNLKAAERMKLYYDKFSTIIPFKRGDRVFLYHPLPVKGLSKKLTSVWEGPFWIVDMINDINARIQDCKDYNRMYIVHVDRLALHPDDRKYDEDADIKSAWLVYVEELPLPIEIDTQQYHRPWK